MNLSTFIARRYFLSGKKKNFINVLSIITMLGVAIGTMALVIVLSVFNGLESFIKDLYNTFDPELKIVPAKGKSFLIADFPLDELKKINGVAGVTQVIEENAGAKYKDEVMFVVVKGVSENYLKEQRLKNNIVEGKLELSDGKNNFAVIGRGVEYTLNISSLNDFYPLLLYYPNRKSNLMNPINAFNQRDIMPVGVFAIEKDFDMKYIITSLKFAEDLFEYKGRRTSLEVTLTNLRKSDEVKKVIQQRIGNNYKVLDRDEQHASLIKAVKMEKLFVYVTLSFIIAVAAINLFFSLTMLAIDKRKDIAVLQSMGGSKKFIRNLFFKEGAIIAFSGAVSGLILGVIICFIQEKFGIVSLGIETSVINAYPVKMVPTDFILTGISIILITIIFSLRPAILASRSDILNYL